MLKCNDTGDARRAAGTASGQAHTQAEAAVPAAEPPRAGIVDEIELEDIEALGAGAVGEPGQRAFYVQARTAATQLTVLVEKEQVALLASRGGRVPRPARRRVPRRARSSLPDDVGRAARADGAALPRPPHRPRLRSGARAGAHRAAGALDRSRGRRRGERRRRAPAPPATRRPTPGYVARIYATRPQVRAMAARGAAVVDGGPAAVPAVRDAHGPGRPPVPPLELTPAQVWPRSSERGAPRAGRPSAVLVERRVPRRSDRGRRQRRRRVQAAAR